MIVSSWCKCVATVLVKENAAVVRYRTAQGRKAVPRCCWFPSIIQGLQCQPAPYRVQGNSLQLFRRSTRPWSSLGMVKEQFLSADWLHTCHCCASPPQGMLPYFLGAVSCFGHSSRDGVVCCLFILFVCLL